MNKYDIAYLLSSDTDLVPAIEEVRSFGRKVNYVGVAKGQSFGLTPRQPAGLSTRTLERPSFS